jgi:hypothetical protein
MADTNVRLRPGGAIEELIQLAKDIRAARARGEETGLMDEEIAIFSVHVVVSSAHNGAGHRSPLHVRPCAIHPDPSSSVGDDRSATSYPITSPRELPWCFRGHEPLFGNSC